MIEIVVVGDVDPDGVERRRHRVGVVVVLVAANAEVRSRKSSRCSGGVNPSGERSLSPVSTFWASTAPRIWKNSSRLFAEMARNLSRSSTGTLCRAPGRGRGG